MPYTLPAALNNGDTFFASHWGSVRTSLQELQSGKAEIGGSATQAFSASTFTEGGTALPDKYQAKGNYQPAGNYAPAKTVGEYTANGWLDHDVNIIDTGGGTKTMTLGNGMLGEEKIVVKKGGDANTLTVSPATSGTKLPRINGGSGSISTAGAYGMIRLLCVGVDSFNSYWVAKTS